MTVIRKDVETRLQELVKEYGDEAEHQKGPDYWDQFKSTDDAIKDLLLYIDIVVTDKE